MAGLCSLDEEEWCEVPVGAAVVFAPSFGVAEFLVFSLPVVWGVAVCFGAAQTDLSPVEAHRYADELLLWQHTRNAAGLSLDSTAARGSSFFQYRHTDGTHFRVQEGDGSDGLRFRSHQFRPIGTWLRAYGTFCFDMGRTRHRAWSDVLRTDEGNPYLSGSPVAANYDHQKFDLNFRLATTSVGPLTYGLAVDYRVGDLSRLRDPRSRATQLAYRLAPSATLRLDAHQTLGLTGWYARDKEKIANITTVQTDPNLLYYVFTGLEHAEGSAGAYTGYQREWVNHELGAEAAYARHTDRHRSVTTLGIARAAEDVWGQTKSSPGRYVAYRYAAATRHRLRTASTIHAFDLRTEYRQGFADEYRQQQVLTTDPAMGNISRRYDTQFTFKKRYQTHRWDAALHYRISAAQGETVTRFAGLLADFSAVNLKHIVPTSTFRRAALDLRAECGGRIAPRWWAEVRAGYHFALHSRLSLADAAAPYAQTMLRPDRDYYGAHHGHAEAALTYRFPLALHGRRLPCFVRAEGRYLRTDRHTEACAAALTFGIFH